MADITWLEAAVTTLEEAPERGLVHYADLAAALVERDPERFGPTLRRRTPHFTLWNTLKFAEAFETVGDGWFRYRPWGDVGERRLSLSKDGGAALRATCKALGPGGAATTVLDGILDDPVRREAEVTLRAEAVGRARALLTAGPVDAVALATLLDAWSVCGGKAPGSVARNRFAPAFLGMYVHRYGEQIDAVGRWIRTLVDAVRDGDVVRTLDDLWARGDLAFAGTIFPTMVLHTLEPERWFPWTDTLARGLGAAGIGSGRADGSGAGYLEYCEGVRTYLAQEGLSAHLADAALSREAARGAAEGSRGTRGAADASGGFGEEGLDLLRDLETAQGAGAEWFASRRDVYGRQVRAPLADLVTYLGREVFGPAVNGPRLLGPDDRVVVDPSKVMARINAQSPRGNGSMYYPYLWAAFFPASQERRQSAVQLFLMVHGGGIEVGLALDAGPQAARDRFHRNLRRERARLDRWLHGGSPPLVLRRHTLDAGPAPEAAPVRDGADLDHLSGPGYHGAVVARLGREEVLASGVNDRVEAAVRKLLPLFALALLEEPAAALGSLGVAAEPGKDEEDAGRDDDGTGASGRGPATGYDLDQLQADTHLEKAWLREVAHAAAFEKGLRGAVGQVVLYGPPGTGKTWLAERIALHLADGDPARVQVVQLHPAFAYEHFVEGYRPAVSGDNLVFRLEAGIVPRLVDRIRSTGKRHVLVLDEMNRGDLPQVMGEMMYLLSRRGKDAEVGLARSGNKLSLPDKLVIIGTMNTADRSIAHVDFALRRRFRFFEVRPSPKVVESVVGARFDFTWAATLAQVLEWVNAQLRKTGRGFEIGHSYLLDVPDRAALEEVWKREIFPSIEDWLDYDPAAIARYSWEAAARELDATCRDVAGEIEAEGP
ncbi:AAA family ATPase [Myxococcota bacterium]|nr:AAA family ATPase [Myxococcota bacterium]